jgi:hypothetical protein
MERLEIVGAPADYKDENEANNSEVEHRSPPPGGSQIQQAT